MRLATTHLLLLQLQLAILFHATFSATFIHPNIALNKPAQQSSTDGNLVAQNGADGTTLPNCARTLPPGNTSGSEQWWMVDLQDRFTVRSVRVSNGMFSCCKDELANFTVEVSTPHPASLPGFPGRTNATACLVHPDAVPPQITSYACRQPVTGRYVRLVKHLARDQHAPQDHSLALCEFEVFSHVEENITTHLPLPGNLALHQPAWQSSTYTYFGEALSASNVVDGNMNGNFRQSRSCSQTLYSKTVNWWMVDLSGPFLISSVRILNRIECCQLRLQNFVIEVSMKDPRLLQGFPGSTHESEVCHAQTDPVPHGAPVPLACDKLVAGRYVRLVMFGVGSLTICEFEILGKPFAKEFVGRFVQVQMTSVGFEKRAPVPMATQRLMMRCARQRVLQSSYNITEYPFVGVDVNAGACRFHQTLTESLAGSNEESVVYKLE